MNFQEKKLYHQIHPLKLFTDWVTAVIALYLLWSQQIVAALIIMLAPSISVSIIIMRYVDLEKIKFSSFGRYIQKYMTRSMEIVRIIGFTVMVLGAWFHLASFVLCGFIIILAGWFRGKLA